MERFVRWSEVPGWIRPDDVPEPGAHMKPSCRERGMGGGRPVGQASQRSSGSTLRSKGVRVPSPLATPSASPPNSGALSGSSTRENRCPSRMPCRLRPSPEDDFCDLRLMSC